MQSLRYLATFAAISFCLFLSGCSEPVEEPAEALDNPSSEVMSLSGDTATYVGSEACADCHQQAWTDWQGSHHDLALQVATPDSVLAEVPAHLEGADFMEHGSGIRITPSAEEEPLPVSFTFGVEPLQQYIVPAGNGAWQTFPMAWDSRATDAGGQRWFNLYDAVFEQGDPMHWKGRANRWNSQCADCHSTGVVKGYDPESQTYETTYQVEDVGCEACHGPGSRHVAAPSEFVPTTLKLQSEQLNTCAPCHSRREQIAEGFQPKKDYYDHYSPRLLSPDLYYVDGQINDEVYVWGSFLQSRMHRAGVTCGDCHNPHSGELQRTGNETCTLCHQTSPPEAFAGQSTGSYDTSDHHFHPEGSEGAQCVACHMPSKTYMGVDDRRDHSFRIPRPDLAATLGVPEPCTTCHTGKDLTWAAATISEHFGPDRPAHFAEAFRAADLGTPAADAALAQLVGDTTQPIMIRASALARLGGYDRGYTLDAIRLARTDEPLLRLATPLAAASLSADRRWRLLAPLLEDDLRAVRHQAVVALLPTVAADPSYRERLAPHLATWLEEQHLNLDFPEALTNIAGAQVALGQPGQAEVTLERALEIQGNWVPGLLNLADLYRTTGRDPEGGELLEKALALAPDQPEVAYSYALWLSRQGKLLEGISYFEQAADLAPNQSHYGYAWAIALNDSGNSDQAIIVLTALLERWPDDQQLLLAGITMLRDQGRFEEALPLLDRLLMQRPNDEQLLQFRDALARAAAAA